METTIRINTDLLNMDIIEGIKKMFPHKLVEITIQEEYSNDDTIYKEWSDEEIRNSKNYIEGDEDATRFLLNRPALAAELQRRIESIENKTAKLLTVSPEELL